MAFVVNKTNVIDVIDVIGVMDVIAAATCYCIINVALFTWLDCLQKNRKRLYDCGSLQTPADN